MSLIDYWKKELLLVEKELFNASLTSKRKLEERASYIRKSISALEELKSSKKQLEVFSKIIKKLSL